MRLSRAGTAVPCSCPAVQNNKVAMLGTEEARVVYVPDKHLGAGSGTDNTLNAAFFEKVIQGDCDSGG